jgi:hypothetical protein
MYILLALYGTKTQFSFNIHLIFRLSLSLKDKRWEGAQYNDTIWYNHSMLLTVIRSKRMRFHRHAARKKGVWKVYKGLIRKPGGKRLLMKSRCRWTFILKWIFMKEAVVFEPDFLSRNVLLSQDFSTTVPNIVRWYDTFNRNWADTRWQQYSSHLHTNNTQNTENETYITITKLNMHNNKN